MLHQRLLGAREFVLRASGVGHEAQKKWAGKQAEKQLLNKKRATIWAGLGIGLARIAVF
jgi:hypothetical protein